MRLCVLDPTSEVASAATAGMARLTSLEGRTIGLLDNGKIRVYELLTHMEAILRSQYGVAHVLRFKKLDASRPVPPEILMEMQSCDAMISAVGD